MKNILSSKLSSKTNGSRRAIVAAFASNILILFIKVIAALVTNSSAMLSEVIHSLVDSGNEIMLLFGLKRSKKHADNHHPFGYGLELYFWTLVVAVSIFGIGGGMAFYEGVTRIFDPAPVQNVVWSYIIIVFSLMFEFASLVVGVKQFRRARAKKATLRFIHETKDPSLFTVLFEDVTDILGLVLALTGIMLDQVLNLRVFDGLASVLIGLTLMGAAFVSARESKDLLIGEGVESETLKKIEDIVQSVDGVEDVGAIRTLYFGPNNLLVNIDVNFHDDMTAEQVDIVASQIEAAIKNRYPQAKQIYIETASDQDIKDFDKLESTRLHRNRENI